MKLVPEVRRAWRWISVQAMTAAGAIQLAWVSIPDDMKASIPPRLVAGVTVGLLVLGIVGRLVKQK